MTLAGLRRPSSVSNNLTQELFQILPSSCLQRLLEKNDTYLARGMHRTRCREKSPKVVHLKTNQATRGQSTSYLNGRLPAGLSCGDPGSWAAADLGSWGGPFASGRPDTDSPNTLQGKREGRGPPRQRRPDPLSHTPRTSSPRASVTSPPPDPRVRHAEGNTRELHSRTCRRAAAGTLHTAPTPPPVTHAARSGCGRAVREGAGRRPEEPSATARAARAESAVFLRRQWAGLVVLTTPERFVHTKLSFASCRQTAEVVLRSAW